ncbi:MAG TPA: hypothetical protein VFK41_05130 [Nocardioidaceae bacterium]|nr:hypothetical protein [Nocardioidaceae bacterium]
MAACAVLVAALAPNQAQAAPGLATHIEFTSIFTPGVTLPDTIGTPDIFVTNDRDFTAVAEFQDDRGAKRAAYVFPARAHLFAVAANGTETALGTREVPANATGVTFTGLRLPEQNGVRLRMELRTLLGLLIEVREGISAPFDVQRNIVIAPASQNNVAIPGGGTGPCDPTGNGICANVITPAGTVTSSQILTYGFCQSADACLTGEYIQSLLDTTSAVTNRNPLKVVLGCAPTLCDAIIQERHQNTSGGGHTGGGGEPGHLELSHISIAFSHLPTGPLATAPECQQSGRVPNGSAGCFDVAASYVDSLGIARLVFLTDGDLRTSTK